MIDGVKRQVNVMITITTTIIITALCGLHISALNKYNSFQLNRCYVLDGWCTSNSLLSELTRTKISWVMNDEFSCLASVRDIWSRDVCRGKYPTWTGISQIRTHNLGVQCVHILKMIIKGVRSCVYVWPQCCQGGVSSRGDVSPNRLSKMLKIVT